MTHQAKLAIAIVWALWSLGWAGFWALSIIGLPIAALSLVAAFVPFLFIRNPERTDHLRDPGLSSIYRKD